MLLLLVAPFQKVYADDLTQQQLYSLGIHYFDVDSGDTCGGTGGTGTTTTTAPATAPTTMYDALNITDIPNNAQVVASYVAKGRTGYADAQKKFPNAYVISINESPGDTTSADIWSGEQDLNQSTGGYPQAGYTGGNGWSPAQQAQAIEKWVKAGKPQSLAGTTGEAKGAYGTPGTGFGLDTIQKILTRDGISRSDYVLWSDGLVGHTRVQTIPNGYDANQGAIPGHNESASVTYDMNEISSSFLTVLGFLGTTSTSGGVPTSGSGSALSQVTTFASEPVTSTWNISDSTAEQWFLKQSGARATITKYGLNSSNIGDITSAVKAANVSAVFFYLYTVNEGGGAGGFINHYPGDTSGGGPGNATRDAQYLASQSQETKGNPATGGGEPGDLPTAEAQQILSALPAGSIGVVYIQATAAVTAELEDLSGKTGDWSGKYNKPLSDAVQNVKTMGGNPQQGGATISAGDCASGGVTGVGMTKAINFATFIANDDGYGYDIPNRASGWQKYQSDPSCTHDCGSFDCSSLVSAALTVGGYFKTNPEFATGNEASELESAGFKKVANSAHTSKGLQPGDVLLASDHTELYIGNNQDVGAHINEHGGTGGGQVGDQIGGHTTNSEIATTPFYDDPWIGVYRAQN